MRTANRWQRIFWLGSFLLLPGLGSEPARAQRFFAEGVVLVGEPRFTLTLQYASWENPFHVIVSVPGGPEVDFGRVSRTVRVVADTPASPLLEAEYRLGSRWRAGFWFNPIRGERLRQTVQVADVPRS